MVCCVGLTIWLEYVAMEVLVSNKVYTKFRIGGEVLVLVVVRERAGMEI